MARIFRLVVPVVRVGVDHGDVCFVVEGEAAFAAVFDADASLAHSAW